MSENRKVNSYSVFMFIYSGFMTSLYVKMYVRYYSCLVGGVEKKKETEKGEDQRTLSLVSVFIVNHHRQANIDDEML